MKAMVSLYDNIAKCGVMFDFYSAVVYIKGEYSEVHVGGNVLLVDTQELANVSEAAGVKVAYIVPQQQVPTSIQGETNAE